MADTKKIQLTKIELAVFHWIRQKTKNTKFIPIMIQYLIAKFTNKIFNTSNILTLEQDLNLDELMQKQLHCSVKKYQLLFRGSEHQYLAQEFHNKCDRNYSDFKTVVIVESTYGNVFGGYTCKSWKNITTCWETDPTSFLFLLKHHKEEEQKKCPLIFELKDNDKKVNSNIWCIPIMGPTFGNGMDLYLDDKGEMNSSTLSAYCNDEYSLRNLCGGNTTWKVEGMGREADGVKYLFKLVDYEVFEIITE